MTSPELSGDAALELLERLPTVALNLLVSEALRDDASSIPGFEAGNLPKERAAMCLVALHGRNVLASREIRRAIASNAHPDDLGHAFAEVLRCEHTLASPNSFDRAQRIERVATRSWHPGSPWPRAFCEAFRIPRQLAGEANYVSVDAIERVSPYVPLNELHDFQNDLRDQILKLLHVDRLDRAIVALPTGAGKTRLMVETTLGLPEVENGDKCLIWVAQHNELCEQAVQCFSQVWSATRRPQNRRLSIQRVWKGQSDEIDWTTDVIVGTPESLVPRLARSSRSQLATLAVTIIDEAHHASADSYRDLFSWIADGAIFGITATPGSSVASASASLWRRFRNKVLIAEQLGHDPIQVLQQRGVLAVPETETISTNERVDGADLGSHRFGDLSPKTLQELGAKASRNRLIIDRLLKVDEASSVLCFAPSVRSARAIAAALSMEGRHARSLDSESDIRFRNETIADFRAGGVQFLINYGVLAAGFDAPRIDCLVMARPTTSPVLFEQMVGRGLRGPANGGTHSCTIIHFEDDFSSFGGIKPMSYSRFLDWTTS